jgi:hypothetical protein
MTAKEISFYENKNPQQKKRGIVFYFKNYINVTKFSAEQS